MSRSSFPELGVPLASQTQEHFFFSPHPYSHTVTHCFEGHQEFPHGLSAFLLLCWMRKDAQGGTTVFNPLFSVTWGQGFRNPCSLIAFWITVIVCFAGWFILLLEDAGNNTVLVLLSRCVKEENWNGGRVSNSRSRSKRYSQEGRVRWVETFKPWQSYVAPKRTIPRRFQTPKLFNLMGLTHLLQTQPHDTEVYPCI